MVCANFGFGALAIGSPLLRKTVFAPVHAPDTLFAEDSPDADAGPNMLAVYLPHGTSLERKSLEDLTEIPQNAVWFDLFMPTQQEDKLVERVLGVAVPTR